MGREAPRPYAEMLDAWRTSCPRLTVWEEAIDRSLVKRTPSRGRHDLYMVTVTNAGPRVPDRAPRARADPPPPLLPPVL